MTYNTGNPIGSTDARDRSDNSENLDLAVNSLSQTFVDRLGVTRDTLEGIYQKSAYYRAGTFDAGYTLTNNRQTLAYGNIEYSWSGAFPKVVQAGSTPATTGGVGAGAWADRTGAALRDELESGGLSIADIANLPLAQGAGKIGVDLFAAYQAGTIGANLVPIPNSDNTGAVDCTSAFNAAILALYNKGGGVLKPIPGTYLINGSVLIPSKIVLDLRGCTLTGIGTNTLIKSGAVLTGVLTDITTEYGTGVTGMGTNFVGGAGVIGGTLANATLGIRAHRWNYGSKIEGVNFSGNLTTSYYSTDCWGLKVSENTIYAPAIMGDFVDWTEVSGNSFEGTSSTITARALTIQGTYGGSYSCSIHNNGFHHWSHGIEINCEADNMNIFSNHFEDTIYHVSGNALTKSGFNIHSNWMKANLTPSDATVIAVTFLNLRDSTIGPNFYSTDGVSSFSAQVLLTNDNCYGNKVHIPYNATNSTNPDTTKYQISAANELIFRNGSNNSAAVHPSITPYAGTSGYTIEQYKHTYHAIANSIPFCIVDYPNTNVYIDTWVPAGDYGSEKMIAFNFTCNGTSTYVIAGYVCMNDITIITKRNKADGTPATGVAVTASIYNGNVRITVSGLSTGGNITGWVKEV